MISMQLSSARQALLRQQQSRSRTAAAAAAVPRGHHGWRHHAPAPAVAAAAAAAQGSGRTSSQQLGTEDEQLRAAAVALASVVDATKATDISLLDVQAVCSWTSYMLLCTGEEGAA